MVDSAVPVEHVIFYKKGKKVTSRNSKGDGIPFRVTLKGGSKQSTEVKNFLKYVVTEVKELNLLKNDIFFLLSDLYGPDHSLNTLSLEKGHVFYVWCFLPYPYEADIPEMAQSVLAHDLIYIRKNLSSSQVKKVKEILKKDTDVEIHSRRFGEKVKLGYSIAAV